MISLASIRDLLLPGVRKLTGDYKVIPTQWSAIFKSEKSKMAVERTIEMRFLGLPTLKSEGGATSFDNDSGQRYTYQQEHVEIGLGYAITRKAVDDNLYKSQFNPSNQGLMKSFKQFDEIRAADVLNTATTYNPNIVGDSKALCATDHPVDGNVLSNRPSTDMDLNENSILSGAITVRQFRDQAGLKVMARTEKLIIPIQLEYVAERLTKTELRPGTANNDVNAIRTAGVLPKGTEVMDFLTSSTSWYMGTDQDGLLHMDRVPFETDMHTDPITGNLLVVGYQRNSFGFESWRGIFGSFPS